MLRNLSVHFGKTDNTLSKTTPMFPFVFVLVGSLIFMLVQGCASVDTHTHPKSLSGEVLTKPDKVLIYDFAISPNEIELERGIGGDIAELVKGTEGTPRSQKAVDVGRKVANSLSENLVKELRSYGILAERATDHPSKTDNVVFVKGRFLSIDEGNSTQRMIIGFGLGRSVVKAQGQVYSMRPQGPKLLSEFESEVKSGRKPGMGPMVGVGAAAGRAATSAVIAGGIGVVSEVGDKLPFSASLEANTQKMAKELAEKGARFWVSRGWLPSEVLK